MIPNPPDGIECESLLAKLSQHRNAAEFGIVSGALDDMIRESETAEHFCKGTIYHSYFLLIQKVKSEPKNPRQTNHNNGQAECASSEVICEASHRVQPLGGYMRLVTDQALRLALHGMYVALFSAKRACPGDFHGGRLTTIQTAIMGVEDCGWMRDAPEECCTSRCRSRSPSYAGRQCP